MSKNNNPRIRKTLLTLSISALVMIGCKETRHPIDAFPKTLSSTCRDGSARVYDECGSQRDILNAAKALADATDRTPLVVYGAEWCVWCHIFDDFAKGDYAPVYFEWARDEDAGKWVMQPRQNLGVQAKAATLNQYVSENFVIAHIEGDHAPDGPATLRAVGLDESAVAFYPFIFSLDSEGQYVDHMLAYKAMSHNESRKNAAGKPLNEFDRAVLLSQLKSLKNAAKRP